MRVSMDIELKDEPGQLILALDPISKRKANLVSVFHYHKKKSSGSDLIQVRLVINSNEPTIKNIFNDFEELGIRVLRIGEEKYSESLTVLLLGHVIHTDLKDTIDRIDNSGFAEVVGMSLSMPEISKPSSASLEIHAAGQKEMEKTIEILRETAIEKDLLLILPIEIE
ncbi:MAG: amino acid-binding protein [Methanosarcinaceae archaeon]|nr:amino acid-binding protein [Methanosarcinaceae archaeon]